MPNKQIILGMFLTTMIIQASNNSIEPIFGRLGDRWGTHWILLGGLIFSILVFIPMAFVQNVWELGGLRLLIGISDAALIPSVQTILAKTSPHRIMGEVFSWNQSFQAVGNVVGPQIGSTVTSFLGYRGVFLSTAFLVLINLFSVFKQTKSFYQ
ncbi:MFS transporter [Lentilactobacillus hilgardii]|nr:MFS transporter [Lentilactobacillus hilgardii]